MPQGWVDCGLGCVDPQYCGACGKKCAALETCVSGSCVSAEEAVRRRLHQPRHRRHELRRVRGQLRLGR